MENKPASSLVVYLGKALNGTPPPLCGRQVAQFSHRIKGWWQEGHPAVKQMPCYKNGDYLLWRPLIGKKAKRQRRIASHAYSILASKIQCSLHEISKLQISATWDECRARTAARSAYQKRPLVPPSGSPPK